MAIIDAPMPILDPRAVDPRDRGGPAQPMLIARDLKKHFPIKGARGKSVQAVDGVSFDVQKGETLGIVGRLKPFGWRDHLLGTDELGRDMLSRILYGGRVSLLMGVVPVLIASLIGGLLGIIGGFVGGRVNTAIMRTMDVFYAFPSVLLAVAIAGAMGGGIGNGMLALTLVFIPPMCRVAETATTQVRALDYIEAARATGAGTIKIIRYHVLGNVLGPVFVYASSLVSVSILLASGLSFLGLGVRPPVPDWGLMLSTLRQSIYVVPFVCALPGAAIFVTSICFNLVSDGLRAAMDVRM